MCPLVQDRRRRAARTRWAALSSYGAWYLVIVGGLAVAAALIAPRGLWDSPPTGPADPCSRSVTECVLRAAKSRG
jgi:hypothetical protein